VAIHAGDLSPLSERASPAGRSAIIQLDGRLRARDLLARAQDGKTVSARITHLLPGPADLISLTGDGEGWLGMLVLEGILIVETEAGRARVGWAVGEDDLIRPWDLAENSLTRQATWRALTACKVALLDPAFSSQLPSTPAVANALVERTARTTRWLLATSLVLSSPVVEERLLLLFALLAEKWGRVTSYGVRVDLPVTHELLAILCGSRRPSVTLALHSLARQDLIARGTDGRWILRRDLGDNHAGRPACWPEYAEALGLYDS
jgi:CRP-like cAMP-binding protein